jgi:hypothetical protein
MTSGWEDLEEMDREEILWRDYEQRRTKRDNQLCGYVEPPPDSTGAGANHGGGDDDRLG